MNANFQEMKDLLEFFSYITIIFGFPIAIIRYFQNIKRQQKDREYGTYNALDEKYLEFLTICFENPELDIFDIPDKEPCSLDPIKKKKETIAFTMLISVFERAFLMYRDQTDEVKKDQWSGWLEYITLYCSRTNFIEAWNISGLTFDIKFQNYMQNLIDNNTSFYHNQQKSLNDAKSL